MKRILYTIAVCFLISCEETVTIDVNQADAKVVIQGLVTNQADHQYIRVSSTVGFYADGIAPGVSTADVSVSDDTGMSFSFSESMEETGLYLPDNDFTAQVGRIYTMNVTVDGKNYTATEELLPITTIDSITYEIDEEEFNESDNNGYYYNALMYTREPQDEVNFYMFKFYRNGEWLNENGEDITVTDDVAVGEAIEGLEMPEYHAIGDSVSMEMYSLTQEQYIYWSDVANLIFSDGGVFSPLPANPRSNISGGALGVFQVSGLASGYVVIQE